MDLLNVTEKLKIFCIEKNEALDFSFLVIELFYTVVV